MDSTTKLIYISPAYSCNRQPPSEGLSHTQSWCLYSAIVAQQQCCSSPQQSEVLAAVQAGQVAGLPRHDQYDGGREHEEGEQQREEGPVVSPALTLHVVAPLLHPRLVLRLLSIRLGLRLRALRAQYLSAITLLCPEPGGEGILQCSCAATALMPCTGPAMEGQNVAGTSSSSQREPLAMMACTATASVKHMPTQLSCADTAISATLRAVAMIAQQRRTFLERDRMTRSGYCERVAHLRPAAVQHSLSCQHGTPCYFLGSTIKYHSDTPARLAAALVAGLTLSADPRHHSFLRLPHPLCISCPYSDSLPQRKSSVPRNLISRHLQLKRCSLN